MILTNKSNDKYNKYYYINNNQKNDRLALFFYKKVIFRYFSFNSILDFGCGTGHLLKKIKDSFFSESLDWIDVIKSTETYINNPNDYLNIAAKLLPQEPFDEKTWDSLYKISQKTFVDETESSKKTSAGAGLTDND